MSNIKKGARAYYADTDYKRDGMTEAYGKIDSLPTIPTPEESDAGKVIKVNESGVYALSDDLHTPVIANPEGTPTADLNTISIGDTIYKVNDARVNKLLDLRVTIDSGGQYNANLPNIAFVDINNNAATLPNYTMTCDKPIQYGGLTVDGAPGVNADKLPAAFTVAFASEFNIEDFPYIRLTKPGLFPTDVAKNIKIEYSLNGTDYVEIADLVSIDWTSDVHVYDMSNGEEVTTVPEIPTPTVADAGKFLGVDNTGAWELDNIPSELPAVTSADAGKVLAVDSQGAWGLSNPIMVLKATYNSSDRQYHWDNSLKNSEIISLIQDVPLIMVDLTTSNSFEHLYCTSKSLYTAKFSAIIDKGQSSYTNKYLIIRDTDNTDVLEVSNNYIAFT